MPGAYLAPLTWPEVEAALRALPVVLIPIGAAAKEHGLHLPMENDAILAEYLTRRVVERAPVLAMPPLTYGYYPAFVDYPGSVCLSLETSRDLVIEVCTSLAKHGARRFYALNTGLSTCRALEPARVTLEEDGLLLEYTRLTEALGPIEERVAEQEGGTHADEIETSMMLYIRPDVVRMERARKDYAAAPGRRRLTRDPQAADGVYSPTGAWGDPTLATVEKGRIVVEALVDHLVAVIEAFARPDYEPAPPDLRYL